MASYARIIDGVAVDVSADPGAQFHPSIAAKFEPVPDEVRPGWRVDEAGNWSAPPAPEPEPEPDPQPVPLDYVRYVALVKQAGGLTAAVATSIIDGTHASDEVNFVQRLMERHSGNFVLTDPLVQQGLDTLVAESVLTQAGRDAILAAWPTG